MPFTSAHSHTRMAPVNNIPKCDVNGMVVVLSTLCMWCLLVI